MASQPWAWAMARHVGAAAARFSGSESQSFIAAAIAGTSAGSLHDGAAIGCEQFTRTGGGGGDYRKPAGKRFGHDQTKRVVPGWKYKQIAGPHYAGNIFAEG